MYMGKYLTEGIAVCLHKFNFTVVGGYWVGVW